MQLTVNLKLKPTPIQRQALLATLERANAACDAISAVAWHHQTFGQYALHTLVYHDIKARFDLTAQVNHPSLKGGVCKKGQALS